MPAIVNVEDAAGVDMSAELKEMINSKAVTLDRGSLGNLYAQLRKNGKFSDKLPIREETVGTLDVAELSKAVQMQAVMDKLEQIANALGRIGTDVAKKAGSVAAAAGATVVGVMNVVAKRL